MTFKARISGLIIPVLLVLPCTVSLSAKENRPWAIQLSFIWSTAMPDGNQAYVVFRKGFELSKLPLVASLQIFANSRYLLWINGQYVLRGPCRFNPKRPDYHLVEVAPYLKSENYSIAVLVHNYGGAVNGRIMKHVPGLATVLTVSGRDVVRTDTTWRWIERTGYRPSPDSWNTFPDVVDARIDEGDRVSEEFNDGRPIPCAMGRPRGL